ncbi:MAG: hypothetical protein DMF85_04695, partial [Acidobacteria bacterium]
MIAALILFLTAQAGAGLSGTVLDAAGAPIGGAVVEVSKGAAAATLTSSADGTWSVSAERLAALGAAAGVRVRVSADGFTPRTYDVSLPAAALRTVLDPSGITERVTVSAPAAQRLSIEASATTLDAAALASAPALMLDDQLRATPGFSLFRRTSSRVANPTTQGATLRGLSASGSSRTLVLADGVPLNDPFGGWVAWTKIPRDGLARAEIIPGGGATAWGNGALGRADGARLGLRRRAHEWLDRGRGRGKVHDRRLYHDRAGVARTGRREGQRVERIGARVGDRRRGTGHAGSSRAVFRRGPRQRDAAADQRDRHATGEWRRARDRARRRVGGARGRGRRQLPADVYRRRRRRPDRRAPDERT